MTPWDETLVYRMRPEKGVDRALLTDFGLARAVDDATLTRTDVIAGTPQFMSPEQARGESVDPRSDLFSLGSTMYAMCTGRPPFRAETSYGILRRIIDTEPRAIREINPEVPDWLAAMIGKLHAKDPAERFQSAEELAKQLEACLAHVQRPTGAALPESVQSLVRQASPPARKSSAAVPERLRRLGNAVLEPRVLLASGFVASVLAVASVVGIGMLGHSTDDDGKASNSSPPPVATAPAQPRSDANSDLASTAWRDGAAEQILVSTHHVERLEVKASRFWDNQLSSAESNNSANSIQPLGQESTK